MSYFKGFCILLFSVALLLVSFCSSAGRHKLSDDDFPYDMGKPDAKYLLNENLTEISGLTWFNSDTILCIQDEKARIYTFSLTGEKSGKYLDFARDGDFEDIATGVKSIFALRSDGKIYEITNYRSEFHEVKEYKTPLSSKNNTEGLAWDKVSGGLLIACKGSASIPSNDEKSTGKAVYRFDLVNQMLDPEPFFTINLKNPESFKSVTTYYEFTETVKNIDFRIPDFQPSAISIHPVSGNIYVLSGTGKLILITDRSGKVLDFSFLNPEIFKQPEGLCFSPAEEMYISSEGQGGHGYILKFAADKKKVR
jgi:uncharacterized protein YjiK